MISFGKESWDAYRDADTRPMARCSLAGGSMTRPKGRLGDEEEDEADWRKGLVIGRSGWKGTGLADDDVNSTRVVP